MATDHASQELRPESLGPKSFDSMTFVATLIANPAAPALDAAAIERVRGLLPAAQAPIWLDPGVAADIPFSGPPENHNRALADRLRTVMHPRPIDVVVQPTA